ncbi:MAG: hypothetical protein LLG06_19775 [Desulfobacteraceae bacterium]|nr:hypothetical protein [Desulfobacteraceae bacterium]
MAFKTVTDKLELQCLSSDQFPPVAADGSTLHIVDTGAQYIAHDGGWDEDLRLIYALRKALIEM